jgi:hypothetical protein
VDAIHTNEWKNYTDNIGAARWGRNKLWFMQEFSRKIDE